MEIVDQILEKYRESSKTVREQGTHFENLIQKFLLTDPRYTAQFKEVETYADWARKNDYPQNDTGIDLVAKRLNEDGYCAIQCKFREEKYHLQKSDIDSFMTASGKADFSLRLVVDSGSGDWGKNAEQALDNQNPPVIRIGMEKLRDSSIDWKVFLQTGEAKNKPKHQLREHQQIALEHVSKGFQSSDRGKLLMACGTGKTFTSLKIAEKLAGKGKRVLFLVPSLSLMSQTITEWTLQSSVALKSFAVCSDVQVGKRKSTDDLADIYIHDLAYPATTKAKKLAFEVENHATDEVMTIVFATYHSIQVIADAQQGVFENEPDLAATDVVPLREFDLVICDEAHRTTGVTLAGESESHFVKIHDAAYIKAQKRLYMTATPRIFDDRIKGAAKDKSAELCSMDDESLYGPLFYSMSFSEAVAKDMLTDYKVLVLAVEERLVSSSLQARLADENNELKLDDATKIIGCYRALAKLDLKDQLMADKKHMKRGVAFCRDIKSSKLIAGEFAKVVDTYLEHEKISPKNILTSELQHVDGTFNATRRNARLAWLKDEPDENTCRILTNARCLSEGVDVPALDAILFMHPRKSQIDVVQSVGRVMRRAPGKQLGYVILPVGVPAGVSASEGLNDNEKYKVVWQVLNALRAHDDRFKDNINKMEYGGDMTQFIEVVAVTEQLRDQRKDEKEQGIGIGEEGSEDYGTDSEPLAVNPSTQAGFIFDEFQQAVYAKIVKKCGERNYWIDWANDIAEIASKHISRIKGIVDANANNERKTFDEFVLELRDDLNDSISDDDAIEMLAQHIITKPVFDALFEGYAFTEVNAVSKAMQKVLNLLNAHHLSKESKSLARFYADVQSRASGIETLKGKQKIIVELYDKFFRNAFPRMTERLGIVYTPVEVVDFIIHSVNDVLKSEFNQNLGSDGVHIIDPFTGTGTFITRLLQSGLISADKIEYKYKNEIHANEIILLAYYIAAINIENVYHEITGNTYAPFNGICLTDTFALYEQDHDMIANLLPDNSERRTRQKALDIRVIMGNPPYSAGQTNANDNNQNVAYQGLDNRIRDTYAAAATATNKNALYDSYIRSIRWASDRIGNNGVIGYVSNASFIDSNTADGLRKCLAEEFSSIYIFHLRGNARTQGELRRKEKDNVFGQGTRTPVAISILVKNPESEKHGEIYFHDIGDYLSQTDKLEKITEFKSIAGITKRNDWRKITPDKHNDWLGQRDDSFDEFIQLGSKKDKTEKTIFENYSRGIATGRDSWCYNASKGKVEHNINAMIDFYNEEVERYKRIGDKSLNIDNFINLDPSRISWGRALKNDISKLKNHSYCKQSVYKGMYRPFTKTWSYFSREMNDMIYQMPKIFPEKEMNNLVISVVGLGTTKSFSVFIANVLPDIQLMANGQCFPLKLYEKQTTDDSAQGDMIGANDYTVKDGITDTGLQHFQQAYPQEAITKEDIFYYIYGLLHSEEYRSRYAANLSKQLPRIPCVKTVKDFWSFSKAGRDLAELHINYEKVEPWAVEYKESKQTIEKLKDSDYRVTKMKFAKHRINGKLIDDKTTVKYNSKITMQKIPLEAYDYIVNGKPAIEWVMERQAVKTDKKSGIKNDANLYATETLNNPKYPLELLQRIITVSLKTMKIVQSLPVLDIDKGSTR